MAPPAEWRLSWCITWGVAWGVAWSAVWLGLLYMTAAGARMVHASGDRHAILARERALDERAVSEATEAAEALMPADLRACVDYIMLYVMQHCPSNGVSTA